MDKLQEVKGITSERREKLSRVEIIVAIVGIILISSLGAAWIKAKLFKELYIALKEENYSYFFQKVDARLARVALPIYTRESMKLDAYIKQKNVIDVKKQFNCIMKQKLNRNQLASVLLRGYDFFSKQKDKEKCFRILEKMNGLLVSEQMQKYQRHYDIVFDASTNYITELQESLNNHKGRMRGYLEYLLATSYKSQKNERSYQEYMRKAASDCKTTWSELEQTIQVM